MPSAQTVQSQDLSIAQVLQTFYVVPSYQREYVWVQEQVEQLLSDILDEMGTASASDAPEYFIGSIVVCPGAEGTLELIDGQQRMTTIYVALCAIRDHFKETSQDVPGALGPQISAYRAAVHLASACLYSRFCVSLFMPGSFGSIPSMVG
jgi:uncharacterized protein with ParB-like and HNH nuclease domain